MSSALSFLAKLVEDRINEAMTNGEFENLPGKGRPLDLEEDAHVPADMRMAYRILKKAGVPPEEILLSKCVIALREKVLRDPELSDEERAQLKKKLRLMDLELSMKMERARRGGF